MYGVVNLACVFLMRRCGESVVLARCRRGCIREGRGCLSLGLEIVGRVANDMDGCDE